MTENSFLYLGLDSKLDPEHHHIRLPYPDQGNLSFLSSYNFKKSKTANGALSFQLSGRRRQTIKVKYSRIECTAWWVLNDFVDRYGPVVFCRFFNHNLGRWETHEVMLDDFSCSPETVVPDSGVAPFYLDATFDITDVGRATVAETGGSNAANYKPLSN